MKNPLLIIAVVFTLSACGNEDRSMPAKLRGVTTSTAVASVPGSPYIPGDPSKPLGAYLVIDNGRKLLALKQLDQPGGPKLEELASNLSEAYAREQDAFKRQDILKALRPELDALLLGAATQRHLAMDFDADQYQVNSYDFQRRAFSLTQMEDNQSDRYFPDQGSAKVMFPNSRDFVHLVVDDEAVARKIEALRHSRGMKMRVYFHVGGFDALNNSLKAQVMAVSLIAPDGTVLATRKGA